jgi:UPF0271 protein
MTEINCDMGEGFGLYRMGDDDALMPLISVANVACGFHASDFNHMRHTVQLAGRHGVRVGAHPSLPDLQGFGRREMKIGREELANCIIYQPHGALYGMAAQQEHVAHAICDAADVFRVPLLGMAGTLHETVYQSRGHRLVSEFYADLDYADSGHLVIVRSRGIIDPQRAAERSLRALAEGKVSSQGGVDIAVRPESICIHSDTPNAVEVVRAVRDAIGPYLRAA